jgi:hypothetical protein
MRSPTSVIVADEFRSEDGVVDTWNGVPWQGVLDVHTHNTDG